MPKPFSLDDQQRDTVCSLVADGYTVRQAAALVDTTARTIQREAKRNEVFRLRLAKAKSSASAGPLQTLRESARTNWRAAAYLMRREDPTGFANPAANVVTQSEANQFITHLVAAIEEGVSAQKERAAVFKLLSVAMPAAMRRRWNNRTIRSKVEWAIGESADQKRIKEDRAIREYWRRDQRRKELLYDMRNHLPSTLYTKVARELLDQEKPWATPRPAAPAERVNEDVASSGSPPASNTISVPPESCNVAPPATLSAQQACDPLPANRSQPTTSSECATPDANG